MTRLRAILSALGLSVLALGCGPPRPTSWRLTGEPVTAEWDQGAQDLATCVQKATHVAPWGGLVLVHPGPFRCYPGTPSTMLCNGTGLPEGVEVAWQPDVLATALGHEFGHAATCRMPHPDCTQTTADAINVVAVACARELAARRLPLTPETTQ